MSVHQVDLRTTAALEIVSPQPQRLVGANEVTRLSSLDGVTLALLCNSKPNAQVLLDAVAAEIKATTAVAKVVRYSKAIPSSAAPTEVYERIAAECDAAVFASADCGSCTSWGIHDTAELERRNVPSVCLVAHPFVPMAEAQSRALEYPTLRRVVFEGPIAGVPEDEVAAKGLVVARQVVESLLRGGTGS